jgi:hypothetical protein
MWNGAVFIPLIDEIETIDPGRPRAFSPAATAWLMKNIASRFWVSSTRKSVQLTVDLADLLHHRGDAVVGADVGRDRHDRKPFVRQGPDVLVQVLRRAAHRDHGRPGSRDHAHHRRADAAAARAGHDDDAPAETQVHGQLRRRASTLPSASAER